MDCFKDYISSGGRSGDVTVAELDAMLSRYGWFSTARVVRSHISGNTDLITAVVSVGRALSSLDAADVDVDAVTELSHDDIIEKFLREGGHRIVAEDGEPETEISVAPDLDGDDDFASEELAEIYLAQGLRSEAIATYRKLILLNPEKSVYFAELIGKIETNN